MRKDDLGSFWDWFNIAFAVCVHGVMVSLGVFIFADNWRGAGLNVAFQGLGIILGWWLGLFIAAGSKRQRKDLLSAEHVIAAFVSGYLLSKLDPVVTAWLGGPHAFDQIVAFRALSFSSSLLAQGLLIAELSWYDTRPMPD
jgi:predicted permease